MCLRIFSSVFESSIKHSVMRRRRKLRRCTRRSVDVHLFRNRDLLRWLGPWVLSLNSVAVLWKPKSSIKLSRSLQNMVLIIRSPVLQMGLNWNDVVEVISYFSQKTTKHTPTDTYPSIVGRIYPIQIYLQLTCISQMLAADI